MRAARICTEKPAGHHVGRPGPRAFAAQTEAPLPEIRMRKGRPSDMERIRGLVIAERCVPRTYCLLKLARLLSIGICIAE